MMLYCHFRKPKPIITVVDAKPMSETGFRQQPKTAEHSRPVITVVDAKPMSEAGFRQEPKAVERPKPLPRDSSKSAVVASPPSSPENTVSFSMPKNKPTTKPKKPLRSLTVRYDPQGASNSAATFGSLTEPKPTSPEVTTTTTRPVPRPRPRSMVMSKSEPLCISAENSDRHAAVARPEPATRPPLPTTKALAPKVPKGYHIVGSSIWYNDDDKNVPPQRPPPVKRKPVVAPPGSSESDETSEPVLSMPEKPPPDIGRLKPTIIRPVSSAVSATSATAAVPPRSQQAAVASTVAGGAQTNGWNAPDSHAQHAASHVTGDGIVKLAAEDVKPQPKKRPTIIRMNRPVESDTTANEPRSDERPVADAADRSKPASQSMAEVPHKGTKDASESESAAVVDVQQSSDHGSSAAVGGKSVVGQELEDHHLKLVPRFHSQPLNATEQELDRRVPPAKPPAPRVPPSVPDENTTS